MKEENHECPCLIPAIFICKKKCLLHLWRRFAFMWSAYLGVQTVLLFTVTCSFIPIRQTSYRGPLKKNEKKLAWFFNYRYRYIDDVLSLNNSNFPIVNFPLLCCNIPAAATYGLCISQLIRYYRACGSYQVFLDRGLLLTRKLLNKVFLFVKLMSSLRKFYGRHHDLVNCCGISLSQMTTDMFHLSEALPGPFLFHDLSPDL